MTETDLDSLISSTLSAMENTVKTERPPAQKANDAVVEASTSTNDVDDCLTKIRQAAPQVSSQSSGDVSDDSLDKLLENLLTPDTIMESMEALSIEMEKFLVGKEDDISEETKVHRRQLEIYKKVAIIYKDSPNIGDGNDSSEAVEARELLAELQSLGQPPTEVVEKLMMSQLAGDEGHEGLMKEFEQFMKVAPGAGGFPGLSKDDEEIIKQLSENPDTMKNLLSSFGGPQNGKPAGDCCIS